MNLMRQGAGVSPSRGGPVKGPPKTPPASLAI